ncbi:MAG: VOC family protein, partial [Ignavibacteriae bacterium]|nr:VOC family protein [Ignavibacteriota bacterium]
NFYKSVFGGEFLMISRFSDIPDQKIPEDAKNQIMHIALPLGKNNILMGSDAPESMGFKITNGNSVQISISTESREEAERLFSGLSAGGNISMPLADQFWGDYFGGFSDKFGIYWMISFTKEKH